MTDFMTRKNYMEKMSTTQNKTKRQKIHQNYWNQFVLSETIQTVSNIIGEDRLRIALLNDDVYFNTIPIEEWDRLTAIELPHGRFKVNEFFPFNRSLLEKANKTITRSALVCIAKEAGRRVIR